MQVYPCLRYQVLCPAPAEDVCPDPPATDATFSSHPGNVGAAQKLCWQREKGAWQAGLQGSEVGAA